MGRLSFWLPESAPKILAKSLCEVRVAASVRGALGNSVVENIIEAPTLLGKLSKAQTRGEAARLLKSVGLEEKASAYPASE